MTDAIENARYYDPVLDMEFVCARVGLVDGEPTVQLYAPAMGETIDIDLETFRNDEDLIVESLPEYDSDHW